MALIGSVCHVERQSASTVAPIPKSPTVASPGNVAQFSDRLMAQLNMIQNKNPDRPAERGSWQIGVLVSVLGKTTKTLGAMWCLRQPGASLTGAYLPLFLAREEDRIGKVISVIKAFEDGSLEGRVGTRVELVIEDSQIEGRVNAR